MICSFCKKEMQSGEYFTLKNNKPDNLCKECRCRNCSDDKPWTYFHIMKYFDIPYIESEWLHLMEKQIKKTISNNEKYKSIFGKYFSLMKLYGYKSFGFSDSPRFNYNFKENKFKRKIFLSDEISEYLNTLIDDEN